MINKYYQKYKNFIKLVNRLDYQLKTYSYVEVDKFIKENKIDFETYLRAKILINNRVMRRDF